MIKCAIFHVNARPSVNLSIRQKNPGFTRASSDVVQINQMLSSFHHHHPAGQCVLLTDEHSQFHGLDESITVKRYANLTGNLIYDRLNVQIQYLQTNDPSSHLIFADSDMLFVASFDDLLSTAFNVGLTYRSIDSMPINGGLILTHQHGASAATEFLQLTLAKFENAHSEHKDWWGDQYALLDAVGAENFNTRTSDLINCAGVVIQLLPCERFNHSPDNSLGAIYQLAENRSLLHFKGPRKWMMRLYWRLHFSQLFAPNHSANQAERTLFWDRAPLALLVPMVQSSGILFKIKNRLKNSIKTVLNQGSTGA